MLDAVDAEGNRGIELVRRHRLAPVVRVGDDPLLHPVGEPHVGLEEIRAEGRRALELLFELLVRGHRAAAGVVDAGTVERIAREEHAGADRRPESNASRCSSATYGVIDGMRTLVIPVCEPDAAEGAAVPLVEMRVHLNQAGHDRFGRRVDHLAGMQLVPMRPRCCE